MDGRFRAARGQGLVVLGLAAVFRVSPAVIFPPHTGRSLSRASASAANAPHTLIGKYCMSCQDADEHEASPAFDTLDFSRVDADAETWFSFSVPPLARMNGALRARTSLAA